MDFELLSRFLMDLRSLTLSSEMGYLESSGSTLDKPHLGHLWNKFSGSSRGLTCGKLLLSHSCAGLVTTRSAVWTRMNREQSL